jgi:lipopolysaccharide transport system ATP-binding protein
MSNTVISVEHLSKAYRLGQIGTGTFTNDLKVWWAKMRGKPNPLLKIGETDHGNRDGEEIWALRDVSFTVEQGEVLGIIGRNGAGKSTLLKILSRVTAPTSGRVKVKGRVASLLEVGTGFHPELTGRENIYLNGAILGMNRREIDRKFDEIVEFSGVEKFIDTPVKRYSSGMYVRLAFAVAAHLEPEILLVDEVLAVGDAEFQKKCLGKMGEVAREGRTVLFVSHNMGMITSLCRTAMLLENGSIAAQGSASETVLSYYNRGRFSPHKVDFSRNGRAIGDHLATLLEAHVEDQDGNTVSEVDIRWLFKIKMRYALHQNVPKPPHPNFHFFDARGEYAFVSGGNKFVNTGTEAGTYLAECIVPGYLLNNGTYFIGLALTFTHQGIHVSFYEKDALSVSIRDPIDETLDEIRGGYSGAIPGPVRPRLEWSIEKVA